VPSSREKDRYYPNGFVGSMVIAGASASPKQFGPPVSSQIAAALSAGDLDSAVGPVTLERPGNVLRGPEGLKLTISPANGFITGEFKHPRTQRVTSVRGIYLPGQNRGTGYFPGSQSGGALQLEIVSPETQ
jgi:hypothetical protein